MAVNRSSRFVELDSDIFKENTVRTRSQFVILFLKFSEQNDIYNIARKNPNAIFMTA